MKQHEKIAFQTALQTAADICDHRSVSGKRPNYDHATVGKIWLPRSQKWAAVMVAVWLPDSEAEFDTYPEINPET